MRRLLLLAAVPLLVLLAAPAGAHAEPRYGKGMTVRSAVRP